MDWTDWMFGRWRNGPDNDQSETHRSPLFHVMLAGGIGGAVGDSVMHSLDTVKTRQQAASTELRYQGMFRAYATITSQEGLARGLYGGYSAAMLGSFPGTTLFFAFYELSKRFLIAKNCPETIAHLTAGVIGDLASSVIYVPSEVLKTRLQLQGRHNNPYFYSGYNYRGLIDATATIIRTEGFGALFFGYKATLARDLPFSALQFAFYEKFHAYAASLVPADQSMPLHLELLTGAAAGGLAGTMTTPLDVVKTRVQTEVRVPLESHQLHSSPQPAHPLSGDEHVIRNSKKAITNPPNKRSVNTSTPASVSGLANRPKLQTNSIIKGLVMIAKSEGIFGLFAGVAPRFVWTSIQTSVMLFLYQVVLKRLNDNFIDPKTGRTRLAPW
ncbi:hypothetical protein CANCADRAFT_142719 [Tortispora caseinolytica NRRL Y-17796]|uniref:Mitochondrial carrier protein n=1 Tax=Tortispora caseinolytica NRRL Y-17796 TaxID=767744 RepID=A0A1E4TD71_9ASCO|nr:hypothetical protein CANCADRAFT_142719 [Tortispora caseinolytica NRRL Y-17796]